MRWIRLQEKSKRYHAVLGTVFGTTMVTYCGRMSRRGAIRDETDTPAAQCRCCTSRVQRPYLIPQQLREVTAAVAGNGEA